MKQELLLQQLQRAGLTGNEAKVYAVLLHHEGLPGGEVAKKAAIDRSLAYTLLNNLKDKGLVTFAIKNRRKQFYAAEPENLLTPVKEREWFLESLIPDLKKIRPHERSKQSFKVYEGVEGIKSYVQLYLREKDVGSFGGTGKLYDFLMKNVPHFIREARQAEARLRVIGTKESHIHHLNGTLGAEVRLLPAVSPATTVVTDSFVAMHLITDQPFAIVIENEEIIESYWNYFEFLWEQAEPVLSRHHNSPKATNSRE